MNTIPDEVYKHLLQHTHVKSNADTNKVIANDQQRSKTISKNVITATPMKSQIPLKRQVSEEINTANFSKNQTKDVLQIHQSSQLVKKNSPICLQSENHMLNKHPIIKPAVLNLATRSTAMPQKIMDGQQKKENNKNVITVTPMKSQIPLKRQLSEEINQANFSKKQTKDVLQVHPSTSSIDSEIIEDYPPINNTNENLVSAFEHSPTSPEDVQLKLLMDILKMTKAIVKGM